MTLKYSYSQVVHIAYNCKEHTNCIFRPVGPPGTPSSQNIQLTAIYFISYLLTVFIYN